MAIFYGDLPDLPLDSARWYIADRLAQYAMLKASGTYSYIQVVPESTIARMRTEYLGGAAAADSAADAATYSLKQLRPEQAGYFPARDLLLQNQEQWKQIAGRCASKPGVLICRCAHVSSSWRSGVMGRNPWAHAFTVCR